MPSTTRVRVAALLTALLPLAVPGEAASGQETESPLSPAGRLRVEIAPVFLSWDSRFGERMEGGRTVETVEGRGFDLARENAADLFGGVGALEASLEEVLGSSFAATLGPSVATAAADVTRIPLRVDLGIFDWLTAGVTVPLVKTRSELLFSYLGGEGANVGANPALVSPAPVLLYVSELTRALGELESAGAAEGLVGDLRSFIRGLSSAYRASGLFPAVGTATGDALRAAAADLDERVRGAGVEGFGDAVPLADAPLSDPAALAAFLEDPAGLNLGPLENRTSLWELGDVELHAAVRVLEGEQRDSAGAPVGLRYEVGAGALLRLGTGATADPDAVLALPAGDGQTDVEGRAFANVAWGRVGLWGDVRYGVQLAGSSPRRIGAPGTPFLAPGSVLLERSPGSYLEVELAPRVHITEELALSGGYRFLTVGEDRWSRIGADPGEPSPGDVRVSNDFADPSVLALETGRTRHQLGAGLIYSTLNAWREGRTGVPFEVRATLRTSVAGNGGMTPKAARGQVGLRIFHRLWGR